VELKYHAESKGTFAAWSTAGWSFMAAQFVPDADNTEDDWHEPSVPTGVCNTYTSAQVNKVIENGTILIIRDGQMYDILGRVYNFTTF